MMDMELMSAMITILNNGRNFYACDYELSDEVISALARKGMIVKTGNSKSAFVEVGYDQLYKKIEVYEWRVSHKGMKAVAEMVRNTAEKMLAFAEAVESLC